MTDSETTEGAEEVEIKPLKDGEEKIIPPKQYLQGNYGFRAKRRPLFSSVTFFSDEPLDRVHRAMTREAPDYGTPEYEAWLGLYGAISGSVAKCYLAEEESALPDESRGYAMLIVANRNPTEDFRKYVLGPMVEQGYISEEVLSFCLARFNALKGSCDPRGI